MKVSGEEEVGGYTSALMSPFQLAASTSSSASSELSDGTEKKSIDIGDEAPVISTVEELLKATTAWRPYPLFIIFSMSFLCSLLCALSAISPAFTASAADDCKDNCSFYTIQH